MSGPNASGRGWAVWTAGLVVVIAAGAATAHGLFLVALGSGTPAGIAWLYPVITDGLALVAYAATTRLSGGGRRYAWAVVVLAAGLSGLAQATYLAGALPPAGPAGVGGVSGEVVAAPPVLRFGVGAWPAIAAAIAAHLLFLIGGHHRGEPDGQPAGERGDQHGGRGGTGQRVGPGFVTTAAPGGSASGERLRLDAGVLPVGVRPVPPVGVPLADPSDVPSGVSRPSPSPAADGAVGVAGPGSGGGLEPVADGRDGVSQAERARSVARALAERTGELPTVRELAEASGVARGTAHRALTALRAPTNGHRPAAEPAGTTPDPDQGAFWEPEKP